MTTTPILLSKKAAASLLGISIGLLEKMIRRKQLVPVRIGRRVLLRREDLQNLAMRQDDRELIDRLSRGAVN